MTISARQSELFAGENWQVLYSAFNSINFNASDPPSINAALRNYIQTNYPEDFNDWIEQSEFVAIIDLLSWLAGTLAFKTDISVRENFLDTAESRASILRLARFLSYDPARNQCATGILKLVGVATNDDVYDSFGVNLANQTITWNNPDDPNWLDRFISVLNGAFVNTNPFGVPLKTGTVQSVSTQLYRLNAYMAQNNFGFSSTVASTSMDFELCNGDFNDGGTLFEQSPSPTNAFNFYYLNDGNGSGSPQTGFFALFKQGTTQSETFYLSYPSPNQVLNVSTANINNTDVWVQTVDDTGAVMVDWTEIPVMLDSNITYNALPISERNIFSVITRDNDQISLRFSDGLFGNAPSGNLKTTYRVSNGLTYAINPTDIEGVQFTVTYLNASGVSKTLTMTFSLMQSVSNAAAAESINSIRMRAPMVWATQNRMVSGEDYNSFPLSTNLAAKIKALNRVYSGQSRYIDLHDPTGTYQDLSIYADDGIFFAEPSWSYTEVPITLNFTSGDLVSTFIQPPLVTTEAANALQNVLMQAVMSGAITAPVGLTWSQSTASLYSATGWFNASSPLIQTDAMIQFSVNGVLQWVGVANVVAGQMASAPPLNTAGPVTLSSPIPSGASVVAVLPAYNGTLPASVVSAMQTKLTANLSFSLSYDYVAGWQIGAPLSDLGPGQLVGTAIPMLECDYLPGVWRITARGHRYVFESITTVEFYDDGVRAIDQQTSQAKPDEISVLKVNQNLNDTYGRALGVSLPFTIDKLWFYPNGDPEPRRTTVSFGDMNSDGFPDNPDAYYRVVSSITQDNYLFWQIGSDELVHPNYAVIGFDTEALRAGTVPLINLGAWDAATNSPTIVSGQGTVNQFYTVTTPGSVLIDGIDLWSVGDIIVFNGTRWTKCPTGGTTAFQVSGATSATNETFWTYSATPSNNLGMWNAATNSPTLTSGVGTVGDYYTVGTAGTTLLDNNAAWSVGDIVIFDGTHWNRNVWQQSFDETFSFARGRGPNVAVSWNSASGATVPSGDEIAFHWRHYASSDQRLDPASQSINDMYVLTYAYDTAVRQWVASGANPASVPQPPTELQLRTQFASMDTYRMFTDGMVWRPVSYKFLFGPAADPTLQMQFKVVRIPNATLSNGEIQSRIINAINTYFGVEFWDFGDTFYWSELSAYIHQQLANEIASIVLVPLYANATFGDGFEVSSRPDQIFISTAQVSNVVIIDANTPANLRMR